MTEKQEFLRKYKVRKYNLVEFLEFVDDRDGRYELIDGRIYMMASPNVVHQEIVGDIGRKLKNYLDDKKCRVFIAPLDVVLFEKGKDKDKSQNVFQPDIFVVCDPKKIAKDKIYGAPDMVIEIVSFSSAIHDYRKKFEIYMKYGVKEYWIVNPETKQIFVKINGHGEHDEVIKYSFGDKIKISIFDDFYLDFKELQI